MHQLLDPVTYVQRFQRWRFKNTALLLISLFALYYFADAPLIGLAIRRIGDLGYFGAFLAGVFFVSIFTVAPAAILLLHLAKVLDPWLVATLAGLGAIVGDYIIFRFLRDRVFEELMPILTQVGRPFLLLFRTPYFAWSIPIIGALIIASPLPDEVGIGLLGASRIKTWQFLVLTFVLNTVGIFAIILFAQVK